MSISILENNNTLNAAAIATCGIGAALTAAILFPTIATITIAGLLLHDAMRVTANYTSEPLTEQINPSALIYNATEKTKKVANMFLNDQWAQQQNDCNILFQNTLLLKPISKLTCSLGQYFQ